MTTTATAPTLTPAVRDAIAVGRAVERILERASTLRVAAVLVLDEVALHPGITHAPLGDAVGLAAGTMTGVMTRLVRDGLVTAELEEKNPKGPARTHFTITPKGEAALQKIRPAVLKITAMLDYSLKLSEILSGLEQLR